VSIVVQPEQIAFKLLTQGNVHWRYAMQLVLGKSGPGFVTTRYPLPAVGRYRCILSPGCCPVSTQQCRYDY